MFPLVVLLFLCNKNATGGNIFLYVWTYVRYICAVVFGKLLRKNVHKCLMC